MRADFEQSSRKGRYEEQGQALEESSIRMVLPQTQSLLIHDSTSAHIDNLSVASSTHHPVQQAFVEPEEEWEVDQILDCRRFRGKLRYLVAWQGYPPSWQPSKNLKNCGDLVRTFHSRKRRISDTEEVVGRTSSE